MCEQVQGAKTWAGRNGSATGIHYYGKECLDIHLLKAAAHEAVAHPTRLGVLSRVLMTLRPYGLLTRTALLTPSLVGFHRSLQNG